MSIYTEKKEVKLDTFNPQIKSFSLVLYDIVLKDGVEISRSNPLRRAFSPGQFSEVADWLSDCEDVSDINNFLNAVWTSEAIEAYQNLINNSES